MQDNKRALSFKVLHLILGVVILIESVIVALNYREVVAADHIGLPGGIILALASVEIVGAILFLILPTIRIGSCILLFTFFTAMIIHLLHGQYNIGGLLVYAAATVAVLLHSGKVENEGSRIN